MTTNTSTIRVLALFSLIATLGPVAAMAQGPLHFSVPFGFTAGPASLPAGDYVVSAIGTSVLDIRNDKGHGAAIIMMQSGEPTKGSGTATLTFRKYGDYYVLARMADPSRGWELPKSRREKEIAAQRASLDPPVVIASSRK